MARGEWENTVQKFSRLFPPSICEAREGATAALDAQRIAGVCLITVCGILAGLLLWLLEHKVGSKSETWLMKSYPEVQTTDELIMERLADIHHLMRDRPAHDDKKRRDSLLSHDAGEHGHHETGLHGLKHMIFGQGKRSPLRAAGSTPKAQSPNGSSRFVPLPGMNDSPLTALKGHGDPEIKVEVGTLGNGNGNSNGNGTEHHFAWTNGDFYGNGSRPAGYA
eukprot:CAMPEP_0184299908 /NCGR_PEP_ID=MMETSP1049-20130417/10433_1 /TAXON_ID=77928 /ORGANISM="Proteomonas sulcata, Strain CCMP704" /LENGTH=221 /DNA_ID=CAMNT_0026610483 /DNA_START=30 /DNA_END=695 /DNA_ORIENTATION=+